MSDMFNLYKYENLLYTMKLTGKEIKDFLEMSYALWTNQMKSPDDHLMLFNEEDKGFGRFKNSKFQFRFGSRHYLYSGCNETSG